MAYWEAKPRRRVLCRRGELKAEKVRSRQREEPVMKADRTNDGGSVGAPD